MTRQPSSKISSATLLTHLSIQFFPPSATATAPMTRSNISLTRPHLPVSTNGCMANQAESSSTQYCGGRTSSIKIQPWPGGLRSSRSEFGLASCRDGGGKGGKGLGKHNTRGFAAGDVHDIGLCGNLPCYKFYKKEIYKTVNLLLTR